NPIDGPAASGHASETARSAPATTRSSTRIRRSERLGRVLAVSVEPPPSRWELPSAAQMPDGAEIAGAGADLAPGTLLAAYRQGLFPMRLRARGPIGLGPLGWWSPDPRGIVPLDGLHVSRSLRRSQRRFEVRIDTAFEAVVRGCADPARPHG